MRFDVYGRFQLEVCRERGQWIAYRISLGKRSKIDDFVVPDDLSTSHEIAQFIDALYHEYARPGQAVELLR